MAVDNPYPEEPARSGWLSAIAGAAIEAVPVLGPLATSLGAEAMRQAQARRVEEWAAIVGARLDALERVGVRIDVADPEFLSTVARLQRAASETADVEKRELLACVAASSGSWSLETYSRRSEFAELVSTLSPAEIAVLSYCDNVTVPDGVDAVTVQGFGVSYDRIYLNNDDKPIDIRGWIEEVTGVPAADAWHIFMAMSTRGLVEDPRAHSFSGGMLKRFTTSFGHEFVEFLRASFH